MAENISIDRKKEREDALSFENLMQEGRRLIQEMAGEIWTDYNDHDPGVTILESLCYALTDLVGRNDFPVEDFLTGEDGRIDLESLALHPPEMILPCRPTTFADYRRLLVDQIPELENAWLALSTRTNLNGLCSIECRLDPEYAHSEQRSMDKVRSLYGRYRNLCEDLDEIRMIKDEPCTLNGRIEIADNASPPDLLAEIYHLCAVHIAGDFEQAANLAAYRMQTPDQLFDGPGGGYAGVGAISSQGGDGEILLIDLFALIKGIDGVTNVKQLWLNKGEQPIFDAVAKRSPAGLLRLQIPAQAEAVGVVLETAGGREIPLYFPTFQARYGDRSYRHQTARQAPEDVVSTSTRPFGEWRDFQSYSSVQHLLPAVYNVGQYGVPESVAAEVKGRAAQLKGYLLLFDQIMANYTANLHHIRHLFAVNSPDMRSYRTQLVHNESHPPLAGIYPQQPQEKLDELTRRYDGFIERKNRVLDYLLALHGETFSHAMLRNFTLYTEDPQAHESTLLEAKAAYLRSVVEVGRDRGGAFDYTVPPDQGNGKGGFQQRISLLLGFRQERRCCLTEPFIRLGLTLAPIFENHEQAGASSTWMPEEVETDGLTTVPIPLVTATETVDSALLLATCQKSIPLLTTSLPEPLLRGGGDLGNFRVAATRHHEQRQVSFVDQENVLQHPLCKGIEAGEAVLLVNTLRRLCLHLNRESEGVHVIEHILLRPSEVAAYPGVTDDFYPFRVSLLFPAWTVRCHDPKFRAQAEDIVRVNTPAHIFAEIYWLDFSQMARFEQLFAAWLAAKHAAVGPCPNLDANAHNLVEFLCACRAPNPHED